MKILSRQYFQTYWLEISHLLLQISFFRKRNLVEEIHVDREWYVLQHHKHIRHGYTSQEQVDGVFPHVLNISLTNWWILVRKITFGVSSCERQLSTQVPGSDILVLVSSSQSMLPCARGRGCWRCWRWCRERRWWQPGSRVFSRNTATS